MLDSSGRLIGINTQIVSPSGAFAGIGFAVPVNTVKRVVPQLIKFGKIIRPSIGVSILHDSIASRWRIQGLIIAKVQPGGPADRAGLQSIQETRIGRLKLSDIITKVDGKSVNRVDDLARILDRHRVGEEITFEIRRNGELQNISMILERLD